LDLLTATASDDSPSLIRAPPTVILVIGRSAMQVTFRFDMVIEATPLRLARIFCDIQRLCFYIGQVGFLSKFVFLEWRSYEEIIAGDLGPQKDRPGTVYIQRLSFESQLEIVGTVDWVQNREVFKDVVDTIMAPELRARMPPAPRNQQEALIGNIKKFSRMRCLLDIISDPVTREIFASKMAHAILPFVDGRHGNVGVTMEPE
jgi:hypothetical protein